MERLYVLIFLLLTNACNDAVMLTGHAPTQTSSSVIDGHASPDGLGIPISGFESNAVLAQLVAWYGVNGAKSPNCTATLVGDRLVAVAGHCVIDNVQDWLYAEAEPVILSPQQVFYTVGPDRTAPLCLLQAQEIRVHPDIEHVPNMNLHDFALVTLLESAIDNCPEVAPLQLNLDPIPEQAVGETVLQGGFGFAVTHEDTQLSPLRLWSILEITELREDHVSTVAVGEGMPSFGDSGSGILRRFSDGSLRNLGVSSSFNRRSETAQFTRLDAQAEFARSVVNPSNLCGSVDERGTCKGTLALFCGSNGFTYVDCQQTETECIVDDEGAACVCSCDQDETCSSSCACDSECPCTCDLSPTCDVDCPCDPNCPEAGCQAASMTPIPSMLLLLVLLGLACQRRR